MTEQKTFPYTWEQAIDVLRDDPQHQALIYDAYLTRDLADNCRRFSGSAEFVETLELIRNYRPDAQDLLDIPGGNGVATFAFSKAGLTVTAVEPDPSESVGRGAIASSLFSAGLTATIVEAFGENLPFDDGSFDVVYVRQGLHHAHDLRGMLSEYARVLRSSGLLIGAREHVVDDYQSSLARFLDSQVDHQLYGGENAFTLNDYRAAIAAAGLTLHNEIEPYDSPINLHPNTPERLREKIVDSAPGRVLSMVLPKTVVHRIGMWRLRRAKLPGRLYTFVATKD